MEMVIYFVENVIMVAYGTMLACNRVENNSPVIFGEFQGN